MSVNANYASTPISGVAALTTGDTSRTAPVGGGSAIFSPGATGGMCERVVIMPTATTITSVVRLFKYDGTTAHLYMEVPVVTQTVTPSAAVTATALTAVAFPEYFPIALPANWSLRATVNDAQTGIQVHAEGGAF
jgi:hypothetical protein